MKKLIALLSLKEMSKKPQGKQEPPRKLRTLEEAQAENNRIRKALGLSAEDYSNLLAYYNRWLLPRDLPFPNEQEKLALMKDALKSGLVSLEGLKKAIGTLI